MRLYLLRKIYELSYWLCDKFAPPETEIFHGFYTNYPHPSKVKDEDLNGAIKKLCEDAGNSKDKKRCLEKEER